MKFEFFGRTFSFLSDSHQQEKAIHMLEKYILKPEMLFLMVILLAYLVVRMVAKIRKKDKLLNSLKRISPWVYLLIILGITVLNRTPGDREIRLAFDNWFTQTGFHESNVLGFLFNLVLYVPFGYLLCKYGKAISAVIIVCASSVLIETMQYIFARGVTAIDDVVANVIGGFIGIAFAVLIAGAKKKRHK